MTYDEAIARIPQRELPDFWVGDLPGVERMLHSVRRGRVETIGQSAGGRPLHLIDYSQGDAESPPAANFNSAVGGKAPAVYFNKPARRRPVVLLVGPVHGQETEGLTGLANLVAIVETGRDLRGRPADELRAMADRCRLLIIPVGNPDGLARFQPRSLWTMQFDDVRFWGQGTWADGSLCGWPGCKQLHPMVGPRVGHLGCYFSDAGINPMHDEFFAPMGSEAPAILRVAGRTGPDLAVSLHSHQLPPALLRPAFVPLDVQAQVRSIMDGLVERCQRRGLPHGQPFEPIAEQSAGSVAFNLVSALHHVSGATACTFECPHGLRGEKACPVTLEQIIEIQLALYEAVLARALAGRDGG